MKTATWRKKPCPGDQGRSRATPDSALTVEGGETNNGAMELETHSIHEAAGPRVPVPFASVATLPALSAPGHAASNVVDNTEKQGQCGPDELKLQAL